MASMETDTLLPFTTLFPIITIAGQYIQDSRSRLLQHILPMVSHRLLRQFYNAKSKSKLFSVVAGVGHIAQSHARHRLHCESSTMHTHRLLEHFDTTKARCFFRIASAFVREVCQCLATASLQVHILWVLPHAICHQ